MLLSRPPLPHRASGEMDRRVQLAETPASGPTEQAVTVDIAPAMDTVAMEARRAVLPARVALEAMEVAEEVSVVLAVPVGFKAEYLSKRD